MTQRATAWTSCEGGRPVNGVSRAEVCVTKVSYTYIYDTFSELANEGSSIALDDIQSSVHHLLQSTRSHP
jgi:hypothetical protein